MSSSARVLRLPRIGPDLLKDEYKGLIWLSNYNTAGTAKLVINTMIQKYGHDEGIQYLVDLDKNIQVYTKSGSGPSKNVGTGECVIGIGFLHDGITQIVDNGYDNIELIIPVLRHLLRDRRYRYLQGRRAPQRCESCGSSTLCLPDCVNLAKLRTAPTSSWSLTTPPSPQAAEFGLDPDNVMDYDFEDAKQEHQAPTLRRS